MSAHATDSRSAPFPDPTVLDEQVLEQLRDLGALEEIGRAYLEELSQQLIELRGALSQQDLGAMGRVAHTLKGASASSGAKGVADACAQIERMARSGTLAGADDLVANIERNFSNVKSAFEKAWA